MLPIAALVFRPKLAVVALNQLIVLLSLKIAALGPRVQALALSPLQNVSVAVRVVALEALHSLNVMKKAIAVPIKQA